MIGVATRKLVRERADHQCEYCHTRQDDEPFVTYRVEHIIAIQHGGGDGENNLALACSHCNLHKGPNLTGIDPVSGLIEPIFHPRRQVWSEHFEFDQSTIVGKTACGRTTVRVLAINTQVRIDLREELRSLLDE